MGRIDIGEHSITTDEENRVICPGEKLLKIKKSRRKRLIMSDDATYMCKQGHLHLVSDFPRLNTNDIKDHQIHTRGERDE